MAYGRRGFSPLCAALTLVTVLPAFITRPLGRGAVCISLITLLPRRSPPCRDPTTLEGSLHGIFDANSTWLFTASNTSFWSVGLQLVQKVQVGFGFQKSGIWIPFHKDVHSFLGFIKTCVSWVLSPFGCCFPHLIVNIDLESEKQMPLTS